MSSRDVMIILAVAVAVGSRTFASKEQARDNVQMSVFWVLVAIYLSLNN